MKLIVLQNVRLELFSLQVLCVASINPKEMHLFRVWLTWQSVLCITYIVQTCQVAIQPVHR